MSHKKLRVWRALLLCVPPVLSSAAPLSEKHIRISRVFVYSTYDMAYTLTRVCTDGDWTAGLYEGVQSKNDLVFCKQYNTYKYRRHTTT